MGCCKIKKKLTNLHSIMPNNPNNIELHNI